MLHDDIYIAQELHVPSGDPDAGMDGLQEEFMHTPRVLS